MVKFWRIVIAEALPTEVQEPERAVLPVQEGRGSPDRPGQSGLGRYTKPVFHKKAKVTQDNRGDSQGTHDPGI